MGNSPIRCFRCYLLMLGPVIFGSANAYGQVADSDPFASGVRPTPALSPADELAGFQLPAGFQVQLVAAEPEIAKPLNMAFDVRGRLWITDTLEYPYAAPLDRPGRDSVKILEDADGDGLAEKITTFADGLNIPLGIYPFKNGAIVFSIPHIWNLQDTDGDGVCDQRTKLYGPFGYDRDTHGMNNAFRRGFDGWLYACHGFNNQTQVAGADGHQISMQSGNTYRMRTDGQRLEHITWGQVNPFGMTCDERGNWFTADCHSRPLYQLLRDGYYPSFGKPHDGLGFVAEMMNHLHGSTAIAGAAITTGSMFPPEFADNIFSGNVMTSRINRNRLEASGATMKAVEQPDLLIAHDPWFRPVDIQFGPDGALYVADFYNRIIGHYEVPLTHPGRDRTSGRIWRIVYRGSNDSPVPPRRSSPLAAAMVPAFPDAAADDHAGDETLVDPARASVAQLVAALDHAVLPHRMRLADQIVDRFGAAAIPSVRQALPTAGARQRVQCLWILQRLGALSPEERTQAGGDPDPLVRTHATKTLAELPQLSSLDRQLLLRQLQDSHPGTRQAAAEAAARHDDPTLIHPLLAALAGTPASDPLLRQALRIAVRNQFRNPAGWKLVVPAQLSEAERDELTDICLALTDLAAGNFIAESLARREAHDHQWEAYVRHAMRYAAGEKIAPLLSLIRQEIGSDPAAQLRLLRSLQPGPAPLPPEVRAWAKELAERLIGRPAPGESRPIAWEQLLFGEGPSADRDPWQVESRRSADGTEALFYSSLPAGERTTSRLRSAAFIAPHELSFYLAGHDGFPAQPLQQQNFVRLLDAGTQLPLRVANAPRNDAAQLVRWDLADVADRSVVLEVTDGDSATAYAWLAVGRFTYGPLNPSLHDRELQQGCELVGQFGLAECEPQLVALLESRSTALESQRAVVETLLSVHPDVRLTAVLAALQGRQPFPELWSRLVRIIAERRPLPGTSDADLAIDQLLSDTVRYVPAAGQREMAAALATDRQGIVRLVELIRAGLAPGRLLTRADIQPKWQAVDDDRLKQQIAEVIAALPPEADDRESLIHDRWRRFTVGGGSAERGAVVFRTNCASCHQLAGQGSLIGPQLDGIGKRGPARLFEDILNPHRNVDIAFRTTTYVVSDGRVLTGLRRREEGSDLIVADGQGKELRIPIADIELTRESPQSLMPDNFGEILTPDQLADLAAYLTSPP